MKTIFKLANHPVATVSFSIEIDVDPINTQPHDHVAAEEQFKKETLEDKEVSDSLAGYFTDQGFDVPVEEELNKESYLNVRVQVSSGPQLVNNKKVNYPFELPYFSITSSTAKSTKRPFIYSTDLNTDFLIEQVRKDFLQYMAPNGLQEYHYSIVLHYQGQVSVKNYSQSLFHSDKSVQDLLSEIENGQPDSLSQLIGLAKNKPQGTEEILKEVRDEIKNKILPQLLGFSQKTNGNYSPLIPELVYWKDYLFANEPKVISYIEKAHQNAH